MPPGGCRENLAGTPGRCAGGGSSSGPADLQGQPVDSASPGDQSPSFRGTARALSEGSRTGREGQRRPKLSRPFCHPTREFAGGFGTPDSTGPCSRTGAAFRILSWFPAETGFSLEKRSISRIALTMLSKRGWTCSRTCFERSTYVSGSSSERISWTQLSGSNKSHAIPAGSIHSCIPSVEP